MPIISSRLMWHQECKAAQTLQPSLSFRMKEVYEERQAGEDLDADYGNNVGGPPKKRRAGKDLKKPSTCNLGLSSDIQLTAGKQPQAESLLLLHPICKCLHSLLSHHG